MTAPTIKIGVPISVKPVEEAGLLVAAVRAETDFELQLPTMIFRGRDVSGVIGMSDHTQDADVIHVALFRTSMPLAFTVR